MKHLVQLICLLKHWVQLICLWLLIVGITACGNPEIPEPPTPEEEDEVEVVVFETDEPATETPTPTATLIPTEEATIEPTDEPSPPLPTSEEISLEHPPDLNPLTGLSVEEPERLQRRPIMVRVGNDPGARPQVALNKADLVYEEVVEWWVTRFTAIYLSEDPEMIAPIRSARLINLQLVPQYQGALGNSGGSDPVRWELSQADIVNLDEFFSPQPYFYRPNENWQTRLAFNAQEARDYMEAEGLEADVDLRGFFFEEKLSLPDLPSGVVEEAAEVRIPYPLRTSDTTWNYNEASEMYLRSINNFPLMDFNGGQISAANVILYFADHQETDIIEDTNGATSIRIIMNGRGPAWILRDGKIMKGNWRTDGQETPLFFFDEGQLMPLKPGRSWVEVIPYDYILEIDGEAHELAVKPGEVPSEVNEAQEESEETDPTATPTPIGARPSRTPTPTPIGARPGQTPEPTSENN